MREVWTQELHDSFDFMHSVDVNQNSFPANLYVKPHELSSVEKFQSNNSIKKEIFDFEINKGQNVTILTDRGEGGQLLDRFSDFQQDLNELSKMEKYSSWQNWSQNIVGMVVVPKTFVHRSRYIIFDSHRMMIRSPFDIRHWFGEINLDIFFSNSMKTIMKNGDIFLGSGPVTGRDIFLGDSSKSLLPIMYWLLQDYTPFRVMKCAVEQ
jgi:hypothetical protein